MRLFDTHAHITDERFDEDRQGVIDRLREAGVEEGDTVSIYDFEFDFVY